MEEVYAKLSRRREQLLEERCRLPVYIERERIVGLVRQHSFVIVNGQAGCGKSTLISQFLYEDSIKRGDSNCRIVVTQPRRIGAISLARRVAEEMGTQLGDKVGYAVRFEERTSPQTVIRYVTDGLMLSKLLFDPDLKAFDVVIIDEAHERSLASDMLLGLMRDIVRRRPMLRLVITSATLDCEKFSRYFYNCPVANIPGRIFPVAIHHQTKDKTQYFLSAAVDAACTIHREASLPGDILVFLTGKYDIDQACKMMGDRVDALHADGIHLPDIVILPVYGALPHDMQQRIFQSAPTNCRKVLFSTNICETSLTVDGVVYVVDSGLVKRKKFNPLYVKYPRLFFSLSLNMKLSSGIDMLEVVPISQSAAVQRAGRAGRTREGECYRLYTTEALNSYELEPQPEIQRTSLAYTVLLLKQLGVRDVVSFEFIDSPAEDNILNAVLQLYRLEAIDSYGELTDLGHLLSKFPLEPSTSKVLIRALQYGCEQDMLTIVAMMSERYWASPAAQLSKPMSDASLDSCIAEAQFKAEEAQSRMFSSFGDHITALFVYDQWIENHRSSHWCRNNFVDARAINYVAKIRDQLAETLMSMKKSIPPVESRVVEISDSITMCRRVIAECNFYRCAHLVGDRGYRKWDDPDALLLIHPSSSVARVPPKWVIYNELVFTSRPFMRTVCAIDYQWIHARLQQHDRPVDLYRLAGHNRNPERRQSSDHKIAQRLKVTSVVNTSSKTEISAECPSRIENARQRFIERSRKRKKV